MSDDALQPLRGMLATLTYEELALLARRLHDQLYAPASPVSRRVQELGFLAALLNEIPQPPERLPYVERQTYERRRPAEAPTAPRAAVLVHRYGSWRAVCSAAWSLLPDGRSPMGAPPRPLGIGPRGSKYDLDECVAAVRECAEAIGRLPTSGDYLQWQRERTRNARDRGSNMRLPSVNAVLREIAPERSAGNGWRLVRSRVFESRS